MASSFLSFQCLLQQNVAKGSALLLKRQGASDVAPMDFNEVRFYF